VLDSPLEVGDLGAKLLQPRVSRRRLWGSKTPITLATCGFGQAGRQSEQRESLGLKPK
jgi:hypothetical protein